MPRPANCARTILLLLSIIFSVALATYPAAASPAVRIMADGSIDPPTAPILTLDNIAYTMTGDINDSIVILRNGITVDGGGYAVRGTGSPGSRGFDLTGRSNITVMNTVITSFAYAFYLSGTSATTLTVNNVTADSPYGIYLEYSTGNHLYSNQVTDTYSGIYLWRSSNNRIENNNVTNGSYAVSLASSSTNNNITANIITNSDTYAIALADSASNRIAANQVRGSNTALSLTASSNNTISGNDMTENSSGITLGSNSSFNVISNNNMTRNGSGVSTVSYSSYNTITSNRVKDGNTCVSLSSYSSFNTISGNNLTNNASNCVFLFISANNTVSSNLIRDNGLYLNRSGVFIETSSNNTFYRNVITHNGVGIFLSGDNNNIYDNDVTDSRNQGIFLNSAVNNSIYHNSFVNNLTQAYAGSTIGNAWDSGYPSGGNYWSDYTGVDLNNGPNQDVTGSDGIGDTSYVIDSDNRDRYPLTARPRESTPPVTTDDYDGLWHTANFTITLSASDDISGVAATYYRIDDGTVRDVATYGQPSITIENPNNKLEYWSVDRAGNEETPHSVVSGIKLDRTPPTGSISIEDSKGFTKSNSVTLTILAMDPASGVYQARFSSDGTTWTPWETVPPSKSWSLTGTDGEKRVYMEVVNGAGLTSQNQSSIVLDTTAPVAEGGPDKTVTFGSPVFLDASGSSDANGVTNYRWTFPDEFGKTIPGKTLNYTFLNEGTYRVTLIVEDPAGNTASDTVFVTVQPALTNQPAPDNNLVILLGASLAAILVVASGTFLWMRRRRTRNPAK